MPSWTIGLPALGWRLLSSRAGLILVVFALLFAWHYFDKRQALSAAREGYVQQFELTAAQTELEAVKRRAAATREANRMLNTKVLSADEAARQFQIELEGYQNEISENRSCIVDDDFLRLLRAN